MNAANPFDHRREALRVIWRLMNAWEPIASERRRRRSSASRRPSRSQAPPPRKAVRLRPRPSCSPPPFRAGLYPDDMMAAAGLDATAIRRSEDAFVDDLIGPGRALGAALIAARCARAYIDLNREALRAGPRRCSRTSCRTFARAPHGPGGRRPGGDRPGGCRGPGDLRPQADLRRGLAAGIETAHAALSRRPAPRCWPRPRPAHGLRDPGRLALHAGRRPRGASRARGGGPCDIVLGDRFGAACASVADRRVERELEAMGYAVARNALYAGGYTTEHYGRPAAAHPRPADRDQPRASMNERPLRADRGLRRLRKRPGSPDAGASRRPTGRGLR